jgi:hypothetical protein
MPQPKKPIVTMRKPPAVPAAADSFVAAAEVPERPAVKASKPAKGRAAPPPTRSAMVTRSDGRELRRMTIYLPADLAKRLAVRCAELDADLSAVIAEAVAKHLDA